jgi:exodeoxyribonuclease VII large subunit
LILLQSRLQGLEKRLKAPAELIQIQWLQLRRLQLQLQQAMIGILDRQNQKLAFLTGQLNVLSPLAVLSRGYAIVKHLKSGVVVQNSAQLEVDDQVQIKLAKGRVSATVTATDGKDT